MKMRCTIPELNPEMDVYRVGTLLEWVREVATRIAEDGKCGCSPHSAHQMTSSHISSLRITCTSSRPHSSRTTGHRFPAVLVLHVLLTVNLPPRNYVRPQPCMLTRVVDTCFHMNSRCTGNSPVDEVQALEGDFQPVQPPLSDYLALCLCVAVVCASMQHASPTCINAVLASNLYNRKGRWRGKSPKAQSSLNAVVACISASRNLLIFSKRGPADSPEQSEFLYLYGKHIHKPYVCVYAGG